MKKLLVLPVLLSLTGCGMVDDDFVGNSMGTSKRVKCAQNADYKDLVDLRMEIDDLKETLDRGYAVHTSTERGVRAYWSVT